MIDAEDGATPRFRNDDKMDVADLFFDQTDSEMMDPNARDGTAMVEALTAAGVCEDKAVDFSKGICSIQPSAIFKEIYDGQSQNMPAPIVGIPMSMDWERSI